MEIQYEYCLYSQNGLEFFNQILQLLLKFQYKNLCAPKFKVCIFCACTKRYYWLLYKFWDFPVMIHSFPGIDTLRIPFDK